MSPTFPPFVSEPTAHVLLGAYSLCLVGLAIFGLHKVKMLWLYWRTVRGSAADPTPERRDGTSAVGGEVPLVCVQCPVYNEPLVIEALLACVAELRWPRLEIQLLDDSTDETTAIIADWIGRHPGQAVRFRHLRRPHRTGYKAGALAWGMEQTDAAFFAVFDADFRPGPDFLERLMPCFADAGVGMVQARWEFSNRRANLLTRFQGIFLDAHFVVEQAARHAAGLFFNFNGTAGVWRRAALVDAGGWTPDTVTEDLDVSYRAQRRGWRFVYLPDYAVASELPQDLTAFKSQQRRWTKGGIQVMRKQLGLILRSDLPWRIKREATSHLLVGFIHPVLMLFTLLFVPCLLLLTMYPSLLPGFMNPVLVLLTGGATVALYLTGQYFRERQWREGLLMLLTAPLMMAFGLAMSVTCCVAVVEGLWEKGGEFVRTPKGGSRASSGGLVSRWRSRTLFAGFAAVELALGLVMLGGAIHFENRGMESLALALAIKATGFLIFAWNSTAELLPRSRPEALAG